MVVGPGRTMGTVMVVILGMVIVVTPATIVGNHDIDREATDLSDHTLPQSDENAEHQKRQDQAVHGGQKAPHSA